MRGIYMCIGVVLLVIVDVEPFCFPQKFRHTTVSRNPICHDLNKHKAKPQQSKVFQDNSLFVSYAQVVSRDLKSPQTNVFKRLFQSTWGALLALFATLKSLFKKKPRVASREQTLSELKAIALQDKVDEKINGAHDDVILVNTAVLPSFDLEEEKDAEQGSSKDMTYDEIQAARKIVEVKLKEIEELRQQTKLSPTAVTSSAPIRTPIKLTAPVATSSSSSSSSAVSVALSASEEEKVVEFGPVDPLAVAPLPLSFSFPFSTSSPTPSTSPSPSPSSSASSSVAPSSSPSSSSGVSLSTLKALGEAGVVSYVLTELCFWALAPLPLLFTSGGWGGAEGSDGSVLLAYTTVVLGVARLALPARLALALALVPWVQQSVLPLLRAFKPASSQQPSDGEDSVEGGEKGTSL